MIHNKPSLPIVFSYFDIVMKCAHMYNTINVITTFFWLWYEGIEKGKWLCQVAHRGHTAFLFFSQSHFLTMCVLLYTSENNVFYSPAFHERYHSLRKEPHYPERLGLRFYFQHTCFNSSLAPTFAWQLPWGICLWTLLIGLHFMDVGALVPSYSLHNPGHFSLIDSLTLYPHLIMPRSSLWKCQDCFSFFSESCLVLKLRVKVYPGFRLLI